MILVKLINEFNSCLYGLFVICLVQFTLGNVGVHQCPDGYDPIRLPSTCELASIALGITYDGRDDLIDETSVCNRCGACSSTDFNSYVSNNYGGSANWICQIEGFATGRFSIIDFIFNLIIFTYIDCSDIGSLTFNF